MNNEVDIKFVDIYHKTDDNDTLNKNLLNENNNNFSLFSNCCINICDCLFSCCLI